MSIYLHDIPLTQAIERFEQVLQENHLLGPLGAEELPLDESLVGRITAEAMWAKLSSPHYHSAAMDGFALRAADTVGATPSQPISLKVGEQAQYVDTGDDVPDWANAVVPIENIEAISGSGQLSENLRCPDLIRLRAAIPPWSHIRPMGEDIVATQLVLPAGQVLRPVDLGAVAAAGLSIVSVRRQPLVTILPTGSELVPIGGPLERGKIIEYNSVVLAGQIRQWGGIPVRFPITPDHLDTLRQQVQEAANTSDLVLINAGSSAGSEDFSAQVIAELGEVLVHGVAVRPGHPVILGLLRRRDGNQIPVIGVPGYPVSAALTGEIFIEPLVTRWLGLSKSTPVEIEASLTRKVTSPSGDDDYLRVVVGRVGGRMLAAPLSRGAGVITSLSRADGLVLLPRGVQGAEAGSAVRVRLYRPLEDLERTIFMIGSHDMSLDVLAQFLAPLGRRLASANAGSLGGLLALKRGEAHLAGSHLLDPDSGVYNQFYIQQYLPGRIVKLFGWVNREQGLMVAANNPKRIKNLNDLVREDVTYVNRQRGAGTRVLLDYHLGQLGIQPEQIQGYDQEEYTHLGVAAAVASGRADCGLGVTAAAVALGLDFLPLYNEEYNLVIPADVAEDDLLAPLFEVINNPDFRAQVGTLPGYRTDRMGKLITEIS